MLVAFSLVFLLAQSMLQVLSPLLTRLAVDKYIRPDAHPLHTPIDAWLPADPWAGLTRIALIYLAVLVGTFLTEFAQTYLMQWTGQLAMFDLRKQLMEHLQRLDLAFYDRNPVGRLVTRVTTDVDVLNDLFASGLVTILGDVLVLGFIVAIMFRLSPLLTGILMAAMPLVIGATLIFRRTRARRATAASAWPSRRSTRTCRSTSPGIVVLQLFNRERRSAQEFDARQSRAHGGVQGRHHRVRLVLSGGGVHLHAGAGGDSDLRRPAHRERPAVAGHAGGVPAIRPALLPPDSGPEREVQHPAGRHGVVGAHLQAARHARRRFCRRASRGPRRPRSRPSNSTTSGSPTRTKTGCCAT